MSHLPADIHRRLEKPKRPDNVLFLNGVMHELEEVEGDVLPRVGESVLIHLASADFWVRHTVVGFYAWPSHQTERHHVRLFVRVVDSDGTFNARSISDVRRMDGSYFYRSE